MEQQKSKNSSSDDDHPKGRWYDCGFCKRGFTNAQALGGHMNIHRKDRGKAKAKAMKNLEADPLIRSFGSGFLPQIVAAGCGQVYMPPPSLHTGNHEYCFFPVWRPEDHIDGNLMHVQHQLQQQQQQEDVDLELRLGRLL